MHASEAEREGHTKRVQEFARKTERVCDRYLHRATKRVRARVSLQYYGERAGGRLVKMISNRQRERGREGETKTGKERETLKQYAIETSICHASIGEREGMRDQKVQYVHMCRNSKDCYPVVFVCMRARRGGVG